MKGNLRIAFLFISKRLFIAQDWQKILAKIQ